MAALSYHTGPRGNPGFDVAINNANGSVTRTVVPAFVPVDGAGNALGTATYTLASNIPLGANAGTTPVTGVRGGVYTFDAQFTGTSVKLQSLGADGVSWRDVLTMSASGTYAGEIRIGANATLRLYNPNASGLTGVSAVLS